MSDHGRGIEVIVVDIEDGCGLVRVRSNRKLLPARFLSMPLDYRQHLYGNEVTLLQLSTIPVRPQTSGSRQRSNNRSTALAELLDRGYFSVPQCRVRTGGCDPPSLCSWIVMTLHVNTGVVVGSCRLTFLS